MSLRTAIIGFGQVAAGYADDPVTARYVRYATHAQVLSNHPSFQWDAVVDPSEEALALARDRWNVPYVARSIEELPVEHRPEVAVVATPPDHRLDVLRSLPDLRAVVVEKPLALTLPEAEEMVELCASRNVVMQVNLWRRADETFRWLAEGGLEELIGRPQTAFGVYGNGLINNGTHMVDFVRMLFGQIEEAIVLGPAAPYPPGPVIGDVNVPFSVRTEAGMVVSMHPVDFGHYRENSLDIWGERGRLSILNEGLTITFHARGNNRALMDEWEVRHDKPQTLEPTVGQALYRLYDNLAAAVGGGASLWSPGQSALETARVVDGILNATTSGQAPHGRTMAVELA